MAQKTAQPVRILVRWPVGRRIESERVANAPLAMATLSSAYGETLAAIQDRLDRGEILKTPAYEYHLLKIV